MAVLRSAPLKTSLINALASVIPFSWVRRMLPDKFIVYGHLVSDKKHAVSAYYRYPDFAEFGRFIAQFRAGGYAFSDLTTFLKESKGKQILLTFDDGFKSIYDELHPYMKQHGLPYAIFVLTDPLKDPGFYIRTIKPDPSLRQGDREFLSEEEIVKLKAQGVHIGFHTRSHMKIETGSDAGQQELTRELSVPEEYKALLSEPRCFAYPYMAPPDYARFNAMMTPAFDYFFDTKGFYPHKQHHFFRVCLDAEKSLTRKNPIDVILKRQFVASLLGRIKKGL